MLAAAEERLAMAGVADARREALMLLSAVRGESPGDVWATRDAAPAAAVAERFARAIERRADGMPTAYAAGTAAFRTLELLVDQRVLIPRPETEGLVEHVLRWAQTRGAWGTAADIGTGSGCIALSLAVEGRFDRIIASDISAEALTVAAANVAKMGAAVRVELREGDLCWPLRGEPADVVACNPPYVTDAEWATLDPAVRDHEPRIALCAGPDGMAHTRALLRDARHVVVPGGLLAMELDCRRVAPAQALARALGWTARIERDLFGRERYLLATRELP
jgi:release factor glutamine methyltransferase